MEDGSPVRVSLYDTDLTLWAEQQAALLRERAGADALDYENLAEEIDDVAGGIKRACRSYVLVMIEHLLKLQFVPSEQDQRGWRTSVRAARKDLHYDLTPTLRARMPDLLEELFDRQVEKLAARGILTDEHGIKSALPLGYTLEQIMDKEWWPEPAYVPHSVDRI